MKNILVTGGCGFIASNFLNYMVKKYFQYNFINLDALYYCASKTNVLKSIRQKKNYSFVKGTIQNQELMDHILIKHEIDTAVEYRTEHIKKYMKEKNKQLREEVKQLRDMEGEEE